MTIFDEKLELDSLHAWVARWDGTEWLFDDPSEGWHGLPPWAYLDRFGSPSVMPVR